MNDKVTQTILIIAGFVCGTFAMKDFSKHIIINSIGVFIGLGYIIFALFFYGDEHGNKKS